MSADIRKVILLVTRTLKMFHVKSSGWQLDAVRNGILLDVRKIFLSRHNRVYNIETCQPGSQHRTVSSIFLPPHSRLSTSTVSKNRAILKKKINNFPHPLLEATERRRKEEEVKIRDRYIYKSSLSISFLKNNRFTLLWTRAIDDQLDCRRPRRTETGALMDINSRDSDYHVHEAHTRVHLYSQMTLSSWRRSRRSLF